LQQDQQRQPGLLLPEDFGEAAHRITTKVAITAIIR
jgi:hypothetical protein